MSLQDQLVKKGLISETEAEKILKEEALKKERENFERRAKQTFPKFDRKPSSKEHVPEFTEARSKFNTQQKREFLSQFNRSRLDKPFEYGYWLFRQDFSKMACSCVLCGKPVEVEKNLETSTSKISTDVKMDELLRNRRSLGHVLATLKDVDKNRVLRLKIEGQEALENTVACIECLVYHLSNKKYFIRPKKDGTQNTK